MPNPQRATLVGGMRVVQHKKPSSPHEWVMVNAPEQPKQVPVVSNMSAEQVVLLEKTKNVRTHASSRHHTVAKQKTQQVWTKKKPQKNQAHHQQQPQNRGLSHSKMTRQ
jgi:dihydroxyacetone kinase-like predicted kinase